MKLWLVRHPPVEVEPGTCYGRTDLALAEPVEPALTAIESLVGPAAALVTSPAARCRRVALHLGHRLGLAAAEDSRWQELDFGAWEGRPWTALAGAELDGWAEGYWHVAPPGGERYRELVDRVEAALAALAPLDTAIVTHAGPIRAALSLLLGWTRERLPEITVPAGTVIALERGPAGWTRC